MVLELSKSAVHHTWEASIFEVDAVDGECKKASGCDNEENKAGAFSGEAVHDREHERQRLEKGVVCSVAQAHAENIVS